jgi:non-specific protein-tyrosine kinase
LRSTFEIEGKHALEDLGLGEYIRVLRRRKWVVLLTAVIVPLATVILLMRQPARYQASADVLLRYQTLSSALSGITDPNSYAYNLDPTRSTSTQLQLAALPAVVGPVGTAVRKAGLTGGPGALSVSSVPDTDILRFSATSATPRLAVLAATDYAEQFTRYRHQLDTGSIKYAIAGLQGRIDELRAKHTVLADQEALSLQTKSDQLQTLLSVERSNAVVVRAATSAGAIGPKLEQYGVLGIGLGIVLGIGLAFLSDGLDSRLRSADEVAAALSLPLLAHIPPPPRRLQSERKLAMIAEPGSAVGEAFRRLRVNLGFAAADRPAQVILAASALPQEGKTTTLANLAVALALAGKSVALVDLDLRHPSVGSLFWLGNDQPGLTGVVLGTATLDQALVSVPLDATKVATAGAPAPRRGGERRSGDGALHGVPQHRNGHTHGASLVVLPAGETPSDPGEFVALDGVRHVIATLRERVDVVLLDVPPLLTVGDGLTVATSADAFLVVVRSSKARRSTARQLSGVLAGIPCEKLGFVLCGVEALDRPYIYHGYPTGHAVPYGNGKPTGEVVK